MSINRVINRRRPLRPEELTTRYRRLKYAEEPNRPRLEREPDYCPSEEEITARYDGGQPLDLLWQVLNERIAAALPFNPAARDASWSAVVRSRELPSGAEHCSSATLEQRLASFYAEMSRADAEALLARAGSEADLHALAKIGLGPMRGCFAAVVPIALFRPFWIRSPLSWRPPASEAKEAVVVSLAQHLLMRFAVPSFLLRAWAEPAEAVDTRWLIWTVALGQGASLRRLTRVIRSGARHTGWGPLARKLQMYLFDVPERSSAVDGVMFAEVVRLGGTQLEVRRLGLDPSYRIDPTSDKIADEDRQFWEQTLHWLVRHREELGVDADVRALLMWARHRHTERDCQFQWHGRTHDSAARDAHEYRVRGSGRLRRLTWESHGWDWNGRVGEGEWSVRELTSSGELREESEAMSHCVDTYDVACRRGYSTVLSLRCGGERRLTIEVQPSGRRILQARGACNRPASDIERCALVRWRRETLDRAPCLKDR